MRNILLGAWLSFFSVAAFSTDLSVDDEQSGYSRVIYVGVGSAETENQYESDATPFSIGYFQRDNTSFGGLDIAREGTLLDSTYNRNRQIDSGVSFNFLAGLKLFRAGNWRMDYGVILGARQSSKKCPRSHLGYQCYADQEPDTSYDFNYGGTLFLSYQQLLIGMRATEESSQLILGLGF